MSRASDAQSRQSKDKDNDSFNSFTGNHQETFGNRNRNTDPSYVNQVHINLDKDNNRKKNFNRDNDRDRIIN